MAVNARPRPLPATGRRRPQRTAGSAAASPATGAPVREPAARQAQGADDPAVMFGDAFPAVEPATARALGRRFAPAWLKQRWCMRSTMAQDCSSSAVSRTASVGKAVPGRRRVGFLSRRCRGERQDIEPNIARMTSRTMVTMTSARNVSTPTLISPRAGRGPRHQGR